MGQTAEQLTQVIEAAAPVDARAAEALLSLVDDGLPRLAAGIVADRSGGWDRIV